MLLIMQGPVLFLVLESCIGATQLSARLRSLHAAMNRSTSRWRHAFASRSLKASGFRASGQEP